MKYRKLFGNALYLIATLLVIPLIIVSITILFNSNEKQKFKETKLNFSVREVQEKWGNPDRRIVNKDGSDVLFYDDAIGWGSYVFVFEKDILVLKTFDD